MLRPKLDGALELWQLTRERAPLFVLFSSLAGTIGTAGQSNYAAANLALEGLARRWRAEGGAAMAIAWGRWDHDSASDVVLTRTAAPFALALTNDAVVYQDEARYPFELVARAY